VPDTCQRGPRWRLARTIRQGKAASSKAAQTEPVSPAGVPQTAEKGIAQSGAKSFQDDLEKGNEMKKRCYVADGSSCQQAFPRFSEARSAAMRAPWANGMVYKHGVDFLTPIGMASSGKLCFTAPGAPFEFPERGGLFEDLEE